MIPSSNFEVARVTVAQLIRLEWAGASLALWPDSARARRDGEGLSIFKGRGMEFIEVRPYQPGDDVRLLDWRVTARTGKPHTKLFREERERPVFLWVDYRAPMFFATRGAFKAVIAARAASLLAWAANHHSDRVGGVIFSEQGYHDLKPMRGKAGVLRFLKALASHPAWRASARQLGKARAVQQALARLQRGAYPGSMIFLISDFRQFDAEAESYLAELAEHNDLMMLFIFDPLELRLPPPGCYRLSDGEQVLVLNVGDNELSKGYQERFERHRHRLQSLARRYRFPLLSCCTNEDPLRVLKQALVGNAR